MFNSTGPSNIFGQAPTTSGGNTSLFGNSSTFTNTGNLFGSSNPTSGAATGLLSGPTGGNSGMTTSPITAFGSAQPTATSGMTLFGSNTAPSGNLFGSTLAGGTNQPSSGSLFGTNSTTVAKPITSGNSLFSGTSSTAPVNANLFGGISGQNTSTSSFFGNIGTDPTSKGDLFGSTKAPSAATQPSGSSLFGSASPIATGARGQSSLFGTTASLFGNTTVTTSEQKSSGSMLFGPSSDSKSPSAALFGQTTTTTDNAAKPTVGKLLEQPPTTSGHTTGDSLFNSAQPSVTSSDASKSAAVGNFFGVLGSDAAKAPAKNLFGSTDTSSKSGGGLFGSTTAATTTTSDTQKRPSGGSVPSLFSGTSATGESSNLFGATTDAKSSTNGASLFGYKKNEIHTTMAAKESSSTATSKLFGSSTTTNRGEKESLDVENGTTSLPAFGGASVQDTSDAAKPSTSIQTKTVPSVETVKSTALEASQYQKVDDLMKSWEQRIKRQVSDFGRFSEAVMNLDLDLCQTVATLENVQQQQSTIEAKQQEIDMSLDQIENHQISLAKMLQQMEGILASQLPEESIHPLQGSLQSLSANLDDSESLLDDLIEDINKIQETLYPGPLGEIIDLVNVQQRTLERLSDECQLLKEKTLVLERM